MNPDEQAARLAAAIEELYTKARIPQPTIACPIAPLGNLIDALGSLVHEPVRGLTQSTAVSFLLQRAVLVDIPQVKDGAALAGFLYANVAGGIILVEATDLVVRRRFSAAHELGHYVLHFRSMLGGMGTGGRFELLEVFPDEHTETDSLPVGVVDFLEGGDKIVCPLSPEEMERDANEFAAKLLMPEDVVSGLVVQYSGRFRDEDLVWRLSTDMLVSRLAMRLRLRGLGLVALDNSRN